MKQQKLKLKQILQPAISEISEKKHIYTRIINASYQIQY